MNKYINIMPMAGLGKRFLKSDYKSPKPLIPIKHKAMFIQAAKSMPKSLLNIFICNEKLVKNYKIKNILNKEYNNKFCLITVKKLTNGQANTCFLAKSILSKKEKIFVHSCDSLIKYDKLKLDKKLQSFDALILTTKPNKIHLKNINSYGWVSMNKNKITNITCKKKASNTPSKDRVIIGSFVFGSKKIFVNMLKNLFKSRKKINNEYYIDMAFRNALKENFKIANFTVSSYVSWGTPEELKKWENK